MKEYEGEYEGKQQINSGLVLKITIPVLLLVLSTLATLMFLKSKKMKMTDIASAQSSDVFTKGAAGKNTGDVETTVGDE